MSLAFLNVDPSAGTAVSPILGAARPAGATSALRDGWRVVTGYGDPAAEAAALAGTVAVADVSHLPKLDLQGPSALELGTGVLAGERWALPVTPTRTLWVGAAGATKPPKGVRTLDVTSAYGALIIGGPLAREAFARFCALDLREASLPVAGFRPGSVARTPGFVLRTAPERFLVLFGAAFSGYLWEVVTDAVAHLGGRPVGLDAIESEARDA